MKYYVVWFNWKDIIVGIDCHETDEARDKSIEQYYQRSTRDGYFKLHDEVC